MGMWSAHTCMTQSASAALAHLRRLSPHVVSSAAMGAAGRQMVLPRVCMPAGSEGQDLKAEEGLHATVAGVSAFGRASCEPSRAALSRSVASVRARVTAAMAAVRLPCGAGYPRECAGNMSAVLYDAHKFYVPIWPWRNQTWMRLSATMTAAMSATRFFPVPTSPRNTLRI